MRKHRDSEGHTGGPRVLNGCERKVRGVVTAELTALSQGSGDVEGLATPSCGMMEAAAVQGLEAIDSRMTSVGTRVDVTHVRRLR
jgi:predicted thioesterase